MSDLRARKYINGITFISNKKRGYKPWWVVGQNEYAIHKTFGLCPWEAYRGERNENNEEYLGGFWTFHQAAEAIVSDINKRKGC